MKELARLVSRCKAEVSVSINAHKSYYQSVEQYLASAADEDVPADVVTEMISRDTVVRVQFYPDTPVGSYMVHHYDLAAAIAEAHRTLDAP